MAAKRPRIVYAALSVVVACVLAAGAAVLTAVNPSSVVGEEPTAFSLYDAFFPQHSVAEPELAAEVEVELESEEALPATWLKPHDIDPIPGTGLVTFNLLDDVMEDVDVDDSADPVLAVSDQAKILKAVKAIENGGYNVGFMLMDMATGKGIAYKESKPIWTASSVKVAVCLYVASQLVDKGKMSWNDSLRNGYAPIKTLMKSALVNSNNDAYMSLFYGMDYQDFKSWMKRNGLFAKKAGNLFPDLSAYEMARVWVLIREFLLTDTPAAKKLGKWLSKTNISEIRQAAKSVAEDKDSVKVYNKAGWCDYIDGGNSCCDGAWVVIDGREYLLCIMTNQPAVLDGKRGYGSTPATSVSYKRVVKLAKALLKAGNSLQ